MTSCDKLLFVADQSEKQRKCIKYRYQAHMSDFQDKQIRRKNQSEKIDRIYIARGISGIRINPQFSDSLEGIQFSRSSEILFSLSHSLLGAPNLGKTLTHFPPITKSHLGFMRTRSNMYSFVGCFGGGNAKIKCYFFGTKEKRKKSL